jgi:hypothetical protein
MPSLFQLKNISFVLYGAIIVSAILVVGGVTSTVANFKVARAQIQSDLDATSVSDGMDIEEIGSALKSISEELPYE